MNNQSNFPSSTSALNSDACPHSFDFVAHEMGRAGTSAAVDMLREATAALSRNKEGNSSNDVFWEQSATVLLKNTIDLYKMAAIEGRSRGNIDKGDGMALRVRRSARKATR